MASLAKMKDKVMPAYVKFGGETVNFEYRPARINKDYDDKLGSAQEANDWEAVYDAICMVLAEWDLEDENGEKVPITTEAIIEKKVPRPLMLSISAKYEEESQNGGLQGKR